MDNVSHSLIGLAAGEALATGRNRNRAALWTASLLANNVPDIDVPLGTLFTDDRLTRLLHHRGHTHTLLAGILQGLIVFAIVYLFFRKRPGFAWRETLFLSVFGTWLHVFADSWNSYGVHPFWPWNNRWYYGDFVFILEPWVWLTLLPPLFFATASRILRGIFGALAALMLGLVWTHSLAPALIAAALTIALAGVTILSARQPRPGRRISFGIAALTFSLLVFFGTSRQLAATYQRPGMELALSPYPGNPFCWMMVEAGFRGDEYEATTLRVAPWPKLFPVQNCPRYFDGARAPLRTATEAPEDKALLPLATFTAKRSELEEIARDCRGRAFLRFSRAPIWTKENGVWQLADLRFERGGGNFARATVPGECVALEPPWEGRFLPRN